MAQRAGGIAVLLDSGEVRRRLARSKTPCLGALHVLKLGPKGLLPGTAAAKAQACRMLCVVVNKAQGHQLELIELKVPQSRSSFRKGQSWGQYLQTVWGDTDGPLVPKKMGEGDPIKISERFVLAELVQALAGDDDRTFWLTFKARGGGAVVLGFSSMAGVDCTPFVAQLQECARHRGPYVTPTLNSAGGTPSPLSVRSSPSPAASPAAAFHPASPSQALGTIVGNLKRNLRRLETGAFQDWEYDDLLGQCATGKEVLGSVLRKHLFNASPDGAHRLQEAEVEDVQTLHNRLTYLLSSNPSSPAGGPTGTPGFSGGTPEPASGFSDRPAAAAGTTGRGQPLSPGAAPSAPDFSASQVFGPGQFVAADRAEVAAEAGPPAATAEPPDFSVSGKDWFNSKFLAGASGPPEPQEGVPNWTSFDEPPAPQQDPTARMVQEFVDVRIAEPSSSQELDEEAPRRASGPASPPAAPERPEEGPGPAAAAATEGGGAEEEENVCVVCFDSKVDCVLLECGHAVVCLACSGGLKGECPMCRRPITRIVKLFYS